MAVGRQQEELCYKISLVKVKLMLPTHRQSDIISLSPGEKAKTFEEEIPYVNSPYPNLVCSAV